MSEQKFLPFFDILRNKSRGIRLKSFFHKVEKKPHYLWWLGHKACCLRLIVEYNVKKDCHSIRLTRFLQPLQRKDKEDPEDFAWKNACCPVAKHTLPTQTHPQSSWGLGKGKRIKPERAFTWRKRVSEINSIEKKLWIGLLLTFSSRAQRDSSYLVSLEPTGDWVQFRSKGKFYSLIRERRLVSSCSRAQALRTGCGRGCFIGISSAGGGGGVLAGRMQLRGSRCRSRCRVWRLCTRPAAAILNWVLWAVLLRTSDWGTRVTVSH